MDAVLRAALTKEISDKHNDIKCPTCGEKLFHVECGVRIKMTEHLDGTYERELCGHHDHEPPPGGHYRQSLINTYVKHFANDPRTPGDSFHTDQPYNTIAETVDGNEADKKQGSN